MLLAQITDLHIKLPGILAYRKIDTAACLARCVARLNAWLPRPDAVLVTGDLTDSGTPGEYRHLAALLAPLELPVYLMVGNHDERAALRSVFDAAYLHGGAADAFVHYTFDLGPVRVIALDSLQPGASAGTLCAARLTWLAAQLEAAREQPVLVALHHPPFATGIGHMDQIALDPAASAQLAALIARYPNVERVLCGHLHRPIQTRFAGTIAATAPSTAHQVMLDVRPDAPSALVLEPPAFTLHHWQPATGVVSHHAYVESFDGPYPFFDTAGDLID